VHALFAELLDVRADGVEDRPRAGPGPGGAQPPARAGSDRCPPDDWLLRRRHSTPDAPLRPMAFVRSTT
jgi:hypothetical protein